MSRQTEDLLTLESVIKRHIEWVLWMSKYNQSQAARILGLPLSTLRSKMKKFGIEMRNTRKDHSVAEPSCDMSPPLSEIPPLNFLI